MRGPWPVDLERLREEGDGVVASWRDLGSLDATPYAGLVVESPAVPLETDPELEALYSYDIIQPLGLGTALAKTKVTRCLVGEPGATYKYLGLRMFATPWTEKTKKVNDSLKRRSLTLGAKSADFTVALVNKMEPPQDDDESSFKKKKNNGHAVSWHADSCLENGSTIGVYCWNRPVSNPAWKLLVRVRNDSEGPRRGGEKKSEDSSSVKPLSISLDDEHLTYFMLDDFNHHHQHAVASGRGATRYSSTHRVARKEGHTAAWILKLGREALAKPNWRCVPAALDIIEFEWLRQWYVQGSGHAKKLAAAWAETIDNLAKLWMDLERLEYHRCRSLIDGASLDDSEVAPRRAKKKRAMVDQRGGLLAYDAALDDLSKRHDKRIKWAQRETDAFWQKMSEKERPSVFVQDDLPAQIFLRARADKTPGNRIPYDGLPSIIQDLRHARAKYAAAEDTKTTTKAENNNTQKQAAAVVASPKKNNKRRRPSSFGHDTAAPTLTFNKDTRKKGKKKKRA